MKIQKIHFIDLTKKKSFISILLFILALILILIGFIKPFEFYISKTYSNYGWAIGFLYLAAYHSRIYWHKNCVQWNKKSINIRVKSIFSKSVQFYNIKAYQMTNNNLTISRIFGKDIIIDLNGISTDDIRKLESIIDQYHTKK